MNTQTDRKPVAIIETPIFNFDDLDDDAKEKARNWFREGALDYDWWDSIFEDAETIGLNLTGFELDRGRYATGNFTKEAGEVVNLILENHGRDCDTYKTADEYRESGMLEDDEDTFLKNLLEDYSILLQHEYEYLLSDEVCDESILANEYTFTEDGERKG